MPLRLDQLLNVTELENDIQEGLINVKTHPFLPLRIYNYSHKTLSVDTWSRSMSLCRGLIVDDEDMIIARPFQKFWNYADPRHTETLPGNLPLSLPELTVKQDGSLLIGFKYKGQVGVATRGSFSSEQAKWADDWLKKNLPALSWPEGWTPLWEMIASFNRIVVDYDGWEGVFALALVDNETGAEASRSVLEAWAMSQNFSPTPLINKKLESCESEDVPNFEGYVATWHRSGEPPHRVKIKQESYCKLHRVLTQLNPKTVWEMLAAGSTAAIDALLNDPKLPETFVAWLTRWVIQLRVQYALIEAEAQGVFRARPESSVRKDQALYFKQTAHLSSILFAMLDGKPYAEIIWDRVRPKATDTFKKDGE